MKKKFLVVQGNKKNQAFINSGAIKFTDYYCENTKNSYSYSLQEQQIVVRQHSKNKNVIVLPNIIKIKDIKAIIASVEASSFTGYKIILSFLFKNKTEPLRFFSSLNLQTTLINWRLIANYYNLPMCLFKNKNQFVYVCDKI